MQNTFRLRNLNLTVCVQKLNSNFMYGVQRRVEIIITCITAIELMQNVRSQVSKQIFPQWRDKNSCMVHLARTMNTLTSGLRNRRSRWEEGKSNLPASTKRGDCFSSPLDEVGGVSVERVAEVRGSRLRRKEEREMRLGGLLSRVEVSLTSPFYYSPPLPFRLPSQSS